MRLKSLFQNKIQVAAAIFLAFSAFAVAQPNGASTIDVASFDADPLKQANKWLSEQSTTGNVQKTTAIAVMKEGYPNIKLVGLGKITNEGIIFYLPAESKTFQEISANPKLSAMLEWKEKGDVERQLRFVGTMSPTGEESTKTITFEGKPVEFKTKAFILKPIRVQFARLNFAYDKDVGVSEFVNYKLENGKWIKENKQVLPFQRTLGNS